MIVGTKKERLAAINHPALVYVVNRENVKFLVEHYEKNGLRWDFDLVVIDELSSFKNYQSQRFKWLRNVRPFVKRWVGLTGTPTSNGLMDLWAEIGILDGGERLGRFIGRYRRRTSGRLHEPTDRCGLSVCPQGRERRNRSMRGFPISQSR